ncbi:MAG: TM0106 family RecB-like putative nuclease [Vicinamibacterales bacterium]
MFLDTSTGQLRLSATDLANFLGCHHRTALEMAAASGKLERPQIDDPRLEALFRRGLDHEAAHVASLKARGFSSVVELGEVKDRVQAVGGTVEAMKAGADVIVQAAVGNERWYGRPDVLTKVARPSAFGAWSYEVVDTKLSRETKAGSVLQLALYCHLLEAVQGTRPEHFHVVTPDGTETFRVDDYAAYFRFVRAGLDEATGEDDEALAAANYPEPVDQCDVCVWAARCAQRRRRDDHLSLVAGISRTQRRELTERGVPTLTALASMPIRPMTFRPKRGAAESYERVREQGRVQLEARSKGLVLELLPVAEGEGLSRLPEPTPGDMFLDLEGDPFAGPLAGPPELRGREYLFGLATLKDDGTAVYTAYWAETPKKEKAAFEAVMDQIALARRQHPGMHVFHYAPYEPSAFKRLMGRHATRQEEMDVFLRSGTFVDLYAVVRQGLRAGVERYSIKNLEPFYGFKRDVDLRDARLNLMAMELAVETDRVGDLKPEVLAAVEGYNRDDCVSTLRLRDWLEQLRADVCAGTRTPEGALGPVDIPRPAQQPGEASEALTEWQQRIEALRGRLLQVEDPSRRLLAFLLDWHRREAKAVWWEYFRLLELPEEELLYEPGAVGGLEFVGEVRREKRSFVHRYRYPPQEMELRRGQKLRTKDGKEWAAIVGVERSTRTIDVLVGPSKAELRPTAAFEHTNVGTREIENAIHAIGEGMADGKPDPLALRLLDRVPPSTRDVIALNQEVLAIQGPPGTGKTYTGGQMICDLVAAGKKVGVSATAHKVIRNLLDAAAKESAKRKLGVRLAHKVKIEEAEADDNGGSGAVRLLGNNDEAHHELTSGATQVLGGTVWLWSRPEFAKSVDVLFIDEAGQVSLANALAMTQAARALVLLGDPQQLDQPKKGSHPDGVDVSVLEHILDGAQTMPERQGVFLAETWRFGSPICGYTSEVFYEGRLRPTAAKHVEQQRLSGGPIDGAGLFVLDVSHDGNRNGSDEEVAAVVALTKRLTAADSLWVDANGQAHQIETSDVLVVSPYNVQVSRLAEAVPKGVRCGTVDKFQGQEAPVVIYSMATSTPEDAPRGMEFLYSLNRFNVATSRAMCAAIVVASPRLVEPECKSPRQMQLANALCRYREMARRIQ